MQKQLSGGKFIARVPFGPKNEKSLDFRAHPLNGPRNGYFPPQNHYVPRQKASQNFSQQKTYQKMRN
jgi:hypothetical protein